MEKRRFNKLPATEDGEAIISGEADGASLGADSLLGTDILPGCIRLVYQLNDAWIRANTKSDQLCKSLMIAEFNADVVAKAIVYIFDSDTYNAEELLQMPDTEEVSNDQ